MRCDTVWFAEMYKRNLKSPELPEEECETSQHSPHIYGFALRQQAVTRSERRSAYGLQNRSSLHFVRTIRTRRKRTTHSHTAVHTTHQSQCYRKRRKRGQTQIGTGTTKNSKTVAVGLSAANQASVPYTAPEAPWEA